MEINPDTVLRFAPDIIVPAWSLKAEVICKDGTIIKELIKEIDTDTRTVIAFDPKDINSQKGLYVLESFAEPKTFEYESIKMWYFEPLVQNWIELPEDFNAKS